VNTDVSLTRVVCHPFSTYVLDSWDIAEASRRTEVVENSSPTPFSFTSHVDTSESSFDSLIRFFSANVLDPFDDVTEPSDMSVFIAENLGVSPDSLDTHIVDGLQSSVWDNGLEGYVMEVGDSFQIVGGEDK
jgi:hypothetical protein